VTTTSTNVIDNPLSGERIVIHRTAADTGGELLSWEMTLAPGGRVPSSHAHPSQTERFTVVSGRLAFRLGHRWTVVEPGHTMSVLPGTVHGFANTGAEPVVVLVEVRPALDMQALLATAAALAVRRRHRPRLLDLALFVRDFRREVRVPYVPVRAVRLVTGLVAAVASVTGLDDRYRGSRAR
jgi:quercetin dioxygenase-like cupin family protein